MSGVDDGHLMTFLRYHLNSDAKGLLEGGSEEILWWESLYELVLFTTVWNFINKTAFCLDTENFLMASNMIYAYSQVILLVNCSVKFKLEQNLDSAMLGITVFFDIPEYRTLKNFLLLNLLKIFFHIEVCKTLLL